jgi:hypothetical protein
MTYDTQIAPFIFLPLPKLPKPPQWLIDKIDFDLEPQVNTIGDLGQRYLEDWDGYTGFANKNVLIKLDEDYDRWVKDNITQNYLYGNANYCWGTPERKSSGAHTDKTRDYVLLYNLAVGGPDASLCYWQEKGQPLIRPRRAEQSVKSSLDLVMEITGPRDTWYLLNTRILHGTENVTELRLNLQVAFEEFPYELLKFV